ncbi:MAG: MlaD family protein [Planctomycetaceae bacterium]|jgi:phospholipid/cholesterol/gamma-HCH transport system substrate-binding protein|nr:MlaD family protein [Planctomycetaceae bacterium]
MELQRVKIRIGLVCVVFLISTAVLVMLFGGGKMPRFFSSDYEIYVLFPQAPMLSENSPVYKNGVKIGVVTSVRLVDDDRKVEITARIQGGVKLYTNEECRLNLNLLGQSTLNFNPKKDGEDRGEAIAAKSTIEGVNPIDLLEMAGDLQGDVSSALRSITSAASELTGTFNNINRIIGTPEEVNRKQQRLEQIVDQAATTMTAVNRVLASVDELISDPEIKQGIKTSSTQLPTIIDEAKILMTNINQMTADMKTLLARADGTMGKVDQNLNNISKFTESLGDVGPQFIDALSGVAQNFEVTAAQLSKFSQSLNNPDGSIGQLINDPEFFQSLNHTVKNVEQVTRQLQPILRDVNVFSDKIARQPSLLGLRGVFEKSPPIKGLPNAFPDSWEYSNQSANSSQATLYQTERIRWIRPPQSRFLPLERQYFRNEPIQQHRFASQVIDLPPTANYVEDAWLYDTNQNIPPNPSENAVNYPSVAHETRHMTQPVYVPQNHQPIAPVVYVQSSAPKKTPELEIDFEPQPANSASTEILLEIDFKNGNETSLPQTSEQDSMIPSYTPIR